MAFFTNKTNQAAEDEAPFIGVIDPALEKFYRKVDDTPDSARKTFGFTVIGLVIALSAVLALIPGIPEFVHVVLGVPLGIALLVVVTAFIHLRDREKRVQDSSYLSLKERHSPSQRMRFGSIALVIFLVASISVRDVIPLILGGVIALNVIGAAYNYIRRTPEEIQREMDGEIDPRDAARLEEEEAEAEEDPAVIEKETEDYIALVNSLPEEQRKILLNPKLNGALAVINDDDIKSKKKRKLFRK